MRFLIRNIPDYLCSYEPDYDITEKELGDQKLDQENKSSKKTKKNSAQS